MRMSKIRADLVCAQITNSLSDSSRGKEIKQSGGGAGEKGHMNPIVWVNSQKFFPRSLPFGLWYHPFMSNNNERYTLVYDQLRAASVLHPLSLKGSPMTATWLLLLTLSSSFHGKCIITYYFMLNLAVWLVCLIKCECKWKLWKGLLSGWHILSSFSSENHCLERHWPMA